MNPKNQRIAIAKACGTLRTEFDFSINYHNNKRIVRRFDTKEEAERAYKYEKNSYGNPSEIEEKINFNRIPDYLNDLNAMHEAEGIMDIDELSDYAELLGISDEIYGHNVVRATAQEKAEAFLKTFNLWTDE
jgi:hypothetical protein